MSEVSSRNHKPSPYVKGDAIDGKYRVEGVLGEGSFGWVFMCTHVRVQALTYAVKVLKAEHTTDVETVARFHREAETVASLRSKHSVRVSDYGVAQEGLPYIVMEFVDGLSIGEMLTRGGPFEDAEVLELSLHILRALDEAHRCGIVHRDLKPDNVIVVQDPDTNRPVARVLDFGLAKILEPENFQVRPEETAAGLVLCTARYAAPDLLKGHPSAQSDIYALGISMIEMIDGFPPYRGEDFYTVAAKHIDPSPVPLGDRVKASALLPVIRRATEKRLERRYATAVEMIADLELIQNEKAARGGGAYFDTVSASVRARITTTAPRSSVVAVVRDRKVLAITGAAVAAIALAIAFAFGARSEPPVDLEAQVPAAPRPIPPEAADTAEASANPIAELTRRQAAFEARLTRNRALAVTSRAGTLGTVVELVLDGSGAAAGEAEAEGTAVERDPTPTREREPTPTREREPEPEQRPARGDRGDSRNDTEATESGTGEDENLFGGIRTIGGR